MTLTIDLTPETEKRLAEEAARRGQSPTDTVRLLLEEVLPPSPEGKQSEEGAAPETDGLTWGARVIAQLKAEGVLGLFADRPEDSPELARKFQKIAEGKLHLNTAEMEKTPATRLLDMLAGWSDFVAKEPDDVIDPLVRSEDLGALYQESGQVVAQIEREDLAREEEVVREFVERRILPILLRGTEKSPM